MAYSPSPQISPTMIPESSSHPHRYSESPPNIPPLTKREKRRKNIADKMLEITRYFDSNRDGHCKAQLQCLQMDMNYILKADLYQDSLLDDSPEAILKELGTLSKAGRSGAQSPEEELPPTAGRWAAVFVEEVNNAMEDRDAKLTMLADTFNKRLESLREDSALKTRVAQEEHRLLTESLRERLIHTIGVKKARLMKEKDQLDIADTNALLLHPNQFSITNPASPGGAQSNRKTRHTRHRLEPEDMPAGVESSLKRKRKAALDLDFGSPGPSYAPIDLDVSLPYHAYTAKLTAQQHTAPLYSVERLFTENELAMHSSTAHTSARRFLMSKRQRSQPSNSVPITPFGTGLGLTEADNDPSRPESSPTSPPVAPEMAINHSQHNTRAAHALNNNTNNNNSASALNLLGDLANLAAPAITQGNTRGDAAKNAKYNPDDFTPNGPSRLNNQTMDDELRRMAAPIEAPINPDLMDGSYAGGIDGIDVSLQRSTRPANLGFGGAGGVAMSKQASLAGFSDIGGGAAMSRTASGAGAVMKRTASGRPKPRGD